MVGCILVWLSMFSSYGIVVARLFLASTLLLLRLQLVQIIVQAIEALVPKAAITFEPVVNVLQRVGLDPAGPPLRLAAACDEAGALQHLEMLGDGGKAHLKRLCELGHRGFAQREPRQDGAARRIGEGRESGAEAIRRHGVMYQMVK